ncbi:UNVERIFIED_CONTAM: PX domain-containing protein EREL1 [Sesamum radiatum]|uniref:PX domain-containing protein EREL1 n=1 Tax=Sesamum radiatum TaxID=300843 RepID=A0AAW2KXQ6_SESRA
MQRQSPPKHRHDGTSPLPLGMDWSPPPRVWAGRETVWPHDPRTGWSYCVTIPSWIVLAKSRDSEPTVIVSGPIPVSVNVLFLLYLWVQVGIQSPEGITTTRTVLRRFNDFLKLHAALKRFFPRKSIPPTPPKGLLRMKTRVMLEATVKISEGCCLLQRRSSLEEWMANILSDIDLSRSMAVASFLELEAAARSSFQDEGQNSTDSHISVTTDSSLHVHPNSSISLLAGSSSLTSDYGSDTAYEASETDKFIKYGMSNIDEGLSMGQAMLENLESYPKQHLPAREIHNNLEHNISNGSSFKSSHHIKDTMEHLPQPDTGTVVRHVRKLSNESIESDRSSQRGNDIHLLVPVDQRQKMNRVLTTLQRRLITAKTDMEDLLKVESRNCCEGLPWNKGNLRTSFGQSNVSSISINQLPALNPSLLLFCSRDSDKIVWFRYSCDVVIDQVKDLEVELETTKQKSKENLERAILIERERVTQMQWDMEELRLKSMELELKLNSQQAQRLDNQSTNFPDNQHKDVMQQELDSAKQRFEDLLKRHQELEMKSKADIKVLVREVKSLRSSQAELNRQLNQSFKEKSKMEAEHLGEDVDTCASTTDRVAELEGQVTSVDEELRQMLTSILVDNGVLRRQVKSLIVHALEMSKSNEKVEFDCHSDVNVKDEVENRG